jgi:hypothetical protein
MSQLSKSLVLTAAVLLLPAAGWANEVNEEAQLDMGAPVAAQSLERYRGREGLEINIQENKANIDKSFAAFNQTGHNVIGGGSFESAVGFPVAVQNTGNNVIIQNAFIINLDVK